VHANVDVTKSLLSDWVSRYEDDGYFNWVMELKETGKKQDEKNLEND
jgi:ribosomal-protein-alanine N-acetyltransferase